MKSFIFILVALVSLSAKAQEVGVQIQSCVVVDYLAEVHMEQIGADISIKVQDRQGVSGPGEGAGPYLILGQEGTTYNVKNTPLATFVADKKILENLIASGISELSSFDQNFDAIYSYVDKLMANLKCQ